jgi:hypothetical protein
MAQRTTNTIGKGLIGKGKRGIATPFTFTVKPGQGGKWGLTSIKKTPKGKG